MRISRIARALNGALLVSLGAPSLVACGGAEAPIGASGASTGSTATGSSGSQSAGSTATGSSGSQSSGASTGSGVDGGTLPPGCALKASTVVRGLGCTETYDLSGAATQCNPGTGGALSATECSALCPLHSTTCNVFDDATGGHVTCGIMCLGTGRRPQGLAVSTFDGPDAVARHLAEIAYLEAASVDAFERLARELEAHGAPQRLVAASRRAARDEVRHARLTKKLAERAGAGVPRCNVEPCRTRSLEEIAVENAVEGCVRETFGAAIAMMQAERAGDARVRRTMKGVARDETRHAELSWAVAQWVDRRLDAKARARVLAARAEAVHALVRDANQEPEASLTERLGVPSAAQARAALGALQASLWSLPAAA